MERNRDDILLAYLLYGRKIVCVKTDNGMALVQIKSSSSKDILLLDAIYKAAKEHAISEGFLTENELIQEAIKRNTWSHIQEKRLLNLQSLVKKYSSEDNYDERMLRKFSRELDELTKKRNKLTEQSAESIAEQQKNLWSICLNCLTIDGERLWKTPNDFDEDDTVLKSILDHYNDTFDITISDIRRIARSFVWRLIWTSAKDFGENILYNRLDELTIDQQMFLRWTNIYENALQSIHPPTQQEFEDDKKFDAWLKRQENESKTSSTTVVRGGPTVDSHEDIFKVTKNPEEAEEVLNLNSPINRMKLKRKMDIINSRGGKPIDETELAKKLGEHDDKIVYVKRNYT
mgnify:CR=1 FL=1